MKKSDFFNLNNIFFYDYFDLMCRGGAAWHVEFSILMSLF